MIKPRPGELDSYQVEGMLRSPIIKGADGCWSATGEQPTMAPCLGLFLIWAGSSVFLQLVPVNGGERGEMG